MLHEEGDIPVYLGGDRLRHAHLYADTMLVDGQKQVWLVIDRGNIRGPDGGSYCTYSDLKRYLAGDTLAALGVEPWYRRLTHGLRVYPFRTVGALLHLAYQVRGVPTMVGSLAMMELIPVPLVQLLGAAGFAVGAFMLGWGRVK
jgi:hypothetical protein